MPAAAVIPAPIAYTKVVAVKKLVVGFLRGWGSQCRFGSALATPAHPAANVATISLVAPRERLVYFEKNSVFKAVIHSALNNAAWNND